jgi:cobalt-zinc-cadmium efflux system membrane fusion protein
VVFVKVEKGFKAQPVKTGSSDGKLVEIVEGLPPAPVRRRGSFVVKAEQGKGSAGHED